MNKKGLVITHLPFKKYLIFVLVIGGLWFAYYFFILNSAGLISLPKSCPEGIIPERLPLSDTYSYSQPEYFWEDDTPINRGDLYFRKGSNQGENVNYLYSIFDIYYQKTPINSDGTVGKKITVKIELVLDSEDKTDEGYKIVDYRCKG
jgi:hypothetical protein